MSEAPCRVRTRIENQSAVFTGVQDQKKGDRSRGPVSEVPL